MRLFLCSPKLSRNSRNVRRLFFEPLETRLVLATWATITPVDSSGTEPSTNITPDEDVDTASFKITVTDPPSEGGTVEFSNSEFDSADVGLDYHFDTAAWTVTFGPGETSKIVKLVPNYDGSPEPTEYVYIHITGASLGASTPYNVDDYTKLSIFDKSPAEVLPGCPTCATGSAGGPLNGGALPAGGGFVPLPSVGVANSGGPAGYSSHPVRYGDGTVLLTYSDLASSADGTNWGLTRQWSNGVGYAQRNIVGDGMVMLEQPMLIQAEGGGVGVVTNGQTAMYFDEDDDTYTPHGFRQETLVHDPGDHEFVLTDLTGARFHFNDFETAPAGQLKSYTDSDANTVDYTFSGTTGLPSIVQRSSTVGSTTITEAIVYTYNSDGQIATATLKRQVTGSGPTNVREADYSYYGADDNYGNAGDLEKVIIKDAFGNTIDTSYYRYYTAADSVITVGEEEQTVGYVHGLKYAFGPDSYARLVNAVGGDLDNTDDEDVAPFADNFFQYDASQRAITEKAQGAGCSTCSGGLGTFQYSYETSTNDPGYNSWATKTTETLPDNVDGDISENIVYTNYMGQVMLQVYHHYDHLTDSDQSWPTYFHYDTQGRLDLRAEPSAVTGYSDSYADLVHYVSGNAADLSDSAGLITNLEYYDATPPSGGVTGYLNNIYIRDGETGTQSLQAHQTYTSHSDGTNTIYLLASSTAYPTSTTNVSASDKLTTTYAYTFFSSTTNRIESQAITDPSGGTTTTFFDTFGRPTWTKDPAGFINYVAYDQATGAVSKTITDVDTTQTSSFSNKPSSWTTPSGGGQQLVTSYLIDPLGRARKITDADGNATYLAYSDTDHEVAIYPGVEISGSVATPTGPIIVLRQDRDHGDGYTEILTLNGTAAYSSTSDSVSGLPSMSNLQSLSRSFYNDAGQTTEARDYFSFASLSYSAAVSLGTAGTNYGQTFLDYDHRGRLKRTANPDGTISRTVYDGLGRPISQWTGTDDEPDEGWWSPDNTDGTNLVKTKEYVYDNGGIGNSLLTSIISYVSHDDPDHPVVRTTTLAYDFRGRLTSTTLPDPDGSGSLDPSTYLTAYDNLGRVTSTTDPLTHVTNYDYDTTNRTLTITQPDPDGATTTLGHPVTVQTFNSRGLLASLTDPDDNTTTWTYDGAGRVATEENELSNTRTYAYDAVGNLTEKSDRLGRTTTYEYDAANRPTSEKWYDGETLVHTIGYTYDAAGRLEEAADPAATYTYGYDRLGRLTSESQDLDGLTPTLDYTSHYTAGGLLDQLQAAIGGTNDFKNTYSYDTFARLSSVIQQSVSGGNAVASKRADFSYNDASQFTQIARYAGTSTSELVANTFYTYDDAGRLARLLHTTDPSPPLPLGEGWGEGALAGYEYSYDIANRIDSINSYTDGLTSYSYDHTNQLTAADHPTGGISDESYSYDENGNRTGGGYETGTNNLISTDGTYTYLHDSEGNRVRRTKISDDTYDQYSYDWRNRLTTVAHVDPTQAFSTANQGTDWGWGDSSDSGTTVGPYDPGSELGDATGWGAVTDSWSNEWQYRIKAVHAVEGNAILIYGLWDNGVPSVTFQFTSGASGTFSFSANAASNDDWEYIASIGTTDDEVADGNDSIGVVVEPYNFPSGYAGGNVTLTATAFENDQPIDFEAAVESAPEGSDVVLLYAYESPAQVEYYLEDVSATEGTDFTDPNSTSSTSWSTLDNTGEFHIPTLVTTAYDATRSFKIHLRIVGYPSTETILEADIYDPQDLIVQTVDYAYDAYNQLVRRSFDDDGPVYEDDPTDTFYSYQQGQIVLQFNGSSASDLSHRYFWNPAAVDQLLADETVTSLSSAGSVLWPLADHLGTIQDLATHDSTTHATTVASHRKYDSYGNLAGESNSAIDELFAFTGRLFDDATGLQYNLNRWYDPKTGQWMGEDPAGFNTSDTNLSRYVRNSPVRYTDPNGLQEQAPIWIPIWKVPLKIMSDMGKIPGDIIEKAGAAREAALKRACDTNEHPIDRGAALIIGVGYGTAGEGFALFGLFTSRGVNWCKWYQRGKMFKDAWDAPRPYPLPPGSVGNW